MTEITQFKYYQLILLLLSFILINYSCAGKTPVADKEIAESSQFEESRQPIEIEAVQEDIDTYPTENIMSTADTNAPDFQDTENMESAEEIQYVDDITTTEDTASSLQMPAVTENPTTHIVEIKNGSMVFTPEKLIINVGDTIKWVNNDLTIDDHIFQSIPGTDPYDKDRDELELVNLYGGQSYEHTFSKIGIYSYFCFIHKGMNGEIIVIKPGQTVEEMKEELAMLKEKKNGKTSGSKEKLLAKETVLIKSGKFIMGSPDDPTEGPPRVMELPDFYIDKYEVTNEEYEEFVNSTGYDTEGNWRGPYAPGKERHPVVNVTYNDAVSYAKWAGKRLPTEAEWEKAARGDNNHREWPWGNEFDDEITNTFGSDEYTGSAPVGSFEEDVSPFGVYDMAGNVSEWTSGQYIAYEWSDAVHPDFNPKKQTIRGGSFNTVYEDQSRTHTRRGSFPQNSFSSVGFRLVMEEAHRQ